MSLFFDDLIRDIDIYFGNILLAEKSYKTFENILVCKISCKTFMSSISLCIRFDKIDTWIKIYDGIRYLVILDRNWFEKICDNIKYFVTKKKVLQIVLIIICKNQH